MTDETTIDSVTLATELTIAWLANANNRVSADDVPAFLEKMHATIISLSGIDAEPVVEDAPIVYEGAVTARKSLGSPDHIISMIDGKPYKTLRRHLATNGLTPKEYIERYNLKADYPMVAPTYSEARRTMAKSIGLGRKPGQTVQKAPEAAAPKPARTTRSAKLKEVAKPNAG